MDQICAKLVVASDFELNWVKIEREEKFCTSAMQGTARVGGDDKSACIWAFMEVMFVFSGV